MLTDNSIEPKEEVQEDEVEFEIESPPLPPAFSSVIPEFKTIVPKDDYDSDPGALDDDFGDESGVKVDEEDGLDGENQKVEVFTTVKQIFRPCQSFRTKLRWIGETCEKETLTVRTYQRAQDIPVCSL